MRVLFCKIHCPSFICFCKPSSHIYKPGPLKLENSPHVPSTAETVVSATNDHHEVCSGDGGDDGVIEAKDESVVDGNQQQQEQEQAQAVHKSLKSSLKKAVLDSKEVQKKRVQWMDFLGKELVEIREFEACEVEDIDNDSEYRKGCVCTIL